MAALLLLLLFFLLGRCRCRWWEGGGGDPSPKVPPLLCPPPFSGTDQTRESKVSHFLEENKNGGRWKGGGDFRSCLALRLSERLFFFAYSQPNVVWIWLHSGYSFHRSERERERSNFFCLPFFSMKEENSWIPNMQVSLSSSLSLSPLLQCWRSVLSAHIFSTSTMEKIKHFSPSSWDLRRRGEGRSEKITSFSSCLFLGKKPFSPLLFINVSRLKKRSADEETTRLSGIRVLQRKRESKSYKLEKKVVVTM